MTRTVLVADDSRGTRQAVARQMRLVGWNIIEASDGGDALDKLAQHDVDLAFIDIDMRVLNGLEVLTALRQSGRYADLPVVVSGSADAAISAALIKQGVADFIVKPFTGDMLRVRLDRLNQLLDGTSPVKRTRVPPAAVRGAVVVVDGDAQYREFVSKVLSPYYPIVDMASGVAVVQACEMYRPAAVIVGSDIGLLTPCLLARKIRNRSELAETRIVLVKKDDDSSDVVEPEAFHAILARNFMATEFLHQFRRAMAQSFADGSETLTSVRRTVESATQQALGMMASSDLRVTGTQVSPIQAGALAAWTDLHLVTESLSVRMVLRCAPSSSKFIAAGLLGVSADEVTADDGLSALGELANVIAGRVKSSAVAQGGTVSFSIPALVAEGQPAPDGELEVALQFEPTDGQFMLTVELGVIADHPQLTAAHSTAVTSSGGAAVVASPSALV